MRIPLLLVVFACSTAVADRAKTVELEGGKPGIGFDDLGYSSRLGRVLVPGGRAGRLYLVDPASGKATAIGGFSTAKDFDGGHDFGITSVDDTGKGLAVTDRTTGELVLVEDAGKQQRAKLAAGPDYVRYVAQTGELWVTEPGKEQIEVFSLAPLAQTATITVKGGPESLVIDHASGRAFTNRWDGATVAIDIKTRKVGKAWPNGCKSSRGIAVDEAHQLVFVACADGRVAALAQSDGKVISAVTPVRGMDIIAYAPARQHLYLAGEASGDTAIVAVSAKGELKVLGKAAGARDGHCVTTDGAGHVFVCDPAGGRLVAIDDTYP